MKTRKMLVDVNRRLRVELSRSDDQLRDARDDRERFRKAYQSLEGELVDILAPALGYPEITSRPRPLDRHRRIVRYDIGDHTGLTLAVEAAEKLKQLAKEDRNV